MMSVRALLMMQNVLSQHPQVRIPTIPYRTQAVIGKAIVSLRKPINRITGELKWCNGGPNFGYRTLIFAFERHLHLLSETMTSEKSSIGGLSKRKVVAVNVKTSDSEVHGRPNGVVGALLPKVLSVDGESANRNDGIVMSNGDVLGGRPNSEAEMLDGTANSRGEGMAEAMTTHIRLQTPAESKLVTRAFTPPKENGNASDQGHFGGNIRPDMEVVSHINVDQHMLSCTEYCMSILPVGLGCDLVMIMLL
uniref:Uncharacterized protein n=1 Tax=Parascaris equorum TaxID=6256 RepID=A0A914S2U3_PAREQ